MPTRTPSYRRASWGGSSHEIRSGNTTLAIFDRRTGWGWGELLDADGEPLVVLDHLGELMVQGQAVPMRLEAGACVPTSTRDGQPALELTVESVTLADALSGSSFEPWVGAALRGPVLRGTVRIEAAHRTGGFWLSWSLESQLDVPVSYLRLPWVRVGAGSFGAQRDDVILPGVEWATDREWTSGDDWFRDPWAMRATPPVDSVAVPVMAVSHGGRWVSLQWRPDAVVTGWFTMPRQRAQPVLASPNFVERSDSSLIGLMIPEASTGGDWTAAETYELHRGQRIELTAVLRTGNGSGLDAVVDWVTEHGLPEPSPPRWPRNEALDRIAHTYATTLSHGPEGFGLGQTPGDIRPVAPRFAHEYLSQASPSSTGATALRARLEDLGLGTGEGVEPDEELIGAAQELLAHQREDGGFAFEPDGMHRSKDDFVVARDLVEPMGQPGDTALGLTAKPALLLVRAAALAPEEFSRPARAALDAARRFTRPAGGDYWETPLQAPNLLAAGYGALAHTLAWQLWGREEDRFAARHWLRSLLVFTHLWQPKHRPMLYNTKPCLCSSDWYYANWVRDHVQWEVLETFGQAHQLGIDLAAVDVQIDWPRYHAGITWAAVRWLLDSAQDDWRPHNLPATLAAYRAGQFDGCLPDTHNSTTGLYGGMAIPPDVVALNLLALPRDELRDAPSGG
ncbi:hypothetical protein [Pseudactinotalea terrae]|uniref:hypothetical protein n=1 Tax=Pseudactinotalea terrae TaxID=1743262 RepID=UPI0012E192F2|nr:hypothetical protein [Pseudactinotalea terrae]